MDILYFLLGILRGRAQSEICMRQVAGSIIARLGLDFIPAVIKLNDIVTYEQLGGSAAGTLGSTDLRRATGTTTDLNMGPKTKQPL